MISRITTKLITTFSSNVRGYPPVSVKVFEDLYNSNQQELVMHFDQLKSLGLRPKGISKIFKEKPSLFKSPEGKQLQIKQILQGIKNKYGEKSLRAVEVFPQLTENSAQIQELISILQKHKFNEQQIERVFEFEPKSLTANLDFRITTAKNLLKNYFHLSEEDSVQAIAQRPFLLRIRPTRYIQSVKYLISKGFSISRLQQLLFSHVDIFDMGVNRLKTLFKIPQQWGVNKQTILRTIQDNVQYLSQCPNQMIYKKINIMNDFKIPQRIAKTIFQQYPSVLISSIGSLDAKLIMINQKLKIPLQMSELFPYLLSLNYNAILRPRGELIMRYNLDLSRQQFQMDEQSFCRTNQIPRDVYQKEKLRYKITNQKDLKKKFYTFTLKKIKEQELQQQRK